MAILEIKVACDTQTDRGMLEAIVYGEKAIATMLGLETWLKAEAEDPHRGDSHRQAMRLVLEKLSSLQKEEEVAR